MNHLDITNATDIRAGEEGLPDDGRYETASLHADIDFSICRTRCIVLLSIESQRFDRKDLKELRKLLKLIEADMGEV